MALALFDLDNTLLIGDSDHYWGEHLINRQLVNEQEHRARNDEFYQDYLNGQLDISAYLKFALSPFIGKDIKQLEDEVERYAEHVLTMIAPQAPTIVEHHRNIGDTLILITATNEFFVRPVAKHLGFEHVIAVEVATDANNMLLGDLQGIPSFGEGKVARIEAWVKQHQQSLHGAYFYSDSHNDIPLLSIVDNPVIVDPDTQLTHWAMSHDKPIISLRK